MARHTQRLRRMTSRLEGDHEGLERARMERMTDEEIEAELVEMALQQGFDPEIAERDAYAALAWIEEQMRAFVDALPPDERAEFIALHGDPREGQRLWPKQGPGGTGAEKRL